MNWKKYPKNKPLNNTYLIILLKDEKYPRTIYYHEKYGFCYETSITYEPMEAPQDIEFFAQVNELKVPDAWSRKHNTLDILESME
jgi:hypothetical protein